MLNRRAGRVGLFRRNEEYVAFEHFTWKNYLRARFVLLQEGGESAMACGQRGRFAGVM
jgi:hypothetical protein